MTAFNWDEYFNRKQDLLYLIWVEEYEIKVNKARDRELARLVHATPFSLSVTTDVPLESMVFTTTSESERFDELERRFYSNLYPQFKHVWLIEREHPLLTFIEEYLKDMVTSYLQALYSETVDWDMMLMAKPLAAEFINSKALLKKIVRWLIRRFALDRMEYYLRKELLVLNTRNFDLAKFSANRNVAGFTDNNHHKRPELSNILRTDSILNHFVKRHPSAVKSLLPQGDFQAEKDQYMEYATRFAEMTDKGTSKKEIFTVFKAEGVEQWTIYRALKKAGISVKDL